METIRDRFSYYGRIREYSVEMTERHNGIRSIVIKYKESEERVVVSWQWFKDSAKRISSLLGIDGVLLVLDKAMEKSKTLEHFVKSIGTVLVPVLILMVLIVSALKWLNNPVQKLGNWLARELDIKIPEPEE